MYSPLTSSAEQGPAAALGSDDQRPALAGRGRPNEGGTLASASPEAVEASSPRLVIRGESFTPPTPTYPGETYEVYTDIHGRKHIEAVPQPNSSAHPFAALTDWLAFSFPFAETDTAVSNLFMRICQEMTCKFGGMADRHKGLNGFHHSFAFDVGGGLFAYGGQRGKAFLSLPGESCALIQDWERVYRFLKDGLQARITRWDGAVDDFSGEYSVDTAMEWYLNGAFGTHGKKPRMRQAGNWAEPDGTGRTLYIGNRKHGKLLRVYEKGKQLNDPNSSWVRWELELHNRDRHIPLEVLLNPGPYVAGAYTCLGWIHEEASRIRTIKKTGELSYNHLVHCLSASYGPMLAVMREKEQSDSVILDMLVRPGKPKRLRLPNIQEPEGL